MEQKVPAANSIERDVASEPSAATPLRRFLAGLEHSVEGQQLLRHIRLFVRKAELEGELSAQERTFEILHEVVVEALRAEDRFDPQRSALAWLLGIAANVVKRHRDKLLRRRQHEVEVSHEQANHPINEEQLFDTLVAHHRTGPESEVVAAMALEQTLAQLPPEDRRIIELFVLHDLSGAEVAQSLGITPGAARVRLHRALAKLRPIWIEGDAGREEKYRDA